MISYSCLYMPPKLVVKDVGARTLIDTKLCSDVFIHPAIPTECPHGEDLLLGKLGVADRGALQCFRSEHPQIMLLIFGFTYIFQILKAIIILLSIFVVDLTSNRGRAQKCSKYNLMNLRVLTCLIGVKRHAKIANLQLVRIKVRRFARSAIRSAASPISNAPYAPSIANFVDSFKSYDSLPSFHAPIIARFGEVYS